MYDINARDDIADVDVEIALDVRIPMRDGLTLSANIYRHRGAIEPSPAVVVLTPYTAQFHHEAAMFFAANRFAFIAVDIRGRGNSEGELSIGNEVSDGPDAVEWVALQSFCNGEVALWGGSYCGYAQWRTAQSRPPHLTTFIPVAAPWRGLDSPMRNNIMAADRVQWLAFIHGRTAQERIFADEAHWKREYQRWFRSGKPFSTLDRTLGDTSAPFQEWLAHPTLDQYWRDLNPSDEDYARIDVPVLTITGAYDADQQGAIEHYQRHCRNASARTRDRHYLVIGPWDHTGTRRPQRNVGGIAVGDAGLVDIAGLERDWLRWTFGAGDRPAFLKKRVVYYVMGAEEWRYADCLDDITTHTMPLYLASPRDGPLGLLSAGVTSDGHQQYVYDPKDLNAAIAAAERPPSLASDERSLDAVWAGHEILYDTEPLSAPIEVSGWFSLDAWFEIDQCDTDFEVSVSEIDQSGHGILLACDIQRARYRDGLDEARLVEPGEILPYRFDRFNFISRLVAAGHRLRLRVRPLHSMYWQKNYNSGKEVSHETLDEARVAHVKLFHGLARPSVLHIPIGTSAR